MADVTNVKVGTCSITFNGVDLGHTQGGVEVAYEPMYEDVSVDKYGKTVVDKVLMGEKFTAKVPLAEYTIANLRNAIPNSTFAGAANTRILIGKSAGQSGRALAATLVLHPLAEGTRKFDIVMYKALVVDTTNLNHKNDAERVIEVEFQAIVDETKSDGNYLGLIGDSTT